MTVVGIDTGGTFTDFVVFDARGIRVHKELSTPSAPEQAILNGLAALELPLAGARIVHGSTVATNTLLEGAGARTVFITNRGFGDVLSIGRQARAALYDLTPIAVAPPVPAELCIETGGRLGADGGTVDDLSEADLDALRARVTALEPQAVAICLLFSFLDPRFEQAIAASLPETLFVTCSSDVLPEFREYERGIATWLNASTGPVMRGYLQRLSRDLQPASLAVMQSSAVTCDPPFAATRAVNLLLSGPAGGLLGAQHVASAAGIERIMTFDMGGTSTDVALIDGAIALTSEGCIGPYPVSVPMVDMHTIGAGGGSIARVDAGGLLRVGPQSAGAEPGPACYGAGGSQATVTDANLVLGRLPVSIRLGGRMILDHDKAHTALAALGAALGGLDVEAVAAGVIDLANDHMRQALRVISVERGIDPRAFTLVSFGGAGGLHVCALAAGLGMRRALVPADAGVLSALGMVVARPGRRQSRTLRKPLDALSANDIEAQFADVAEPGIAALLAAGHARAELELSHSADLCYSGQSYAINLPWRDVDELKAAFHRAHEQRYGHRLDVPLELVTLRVAVDVRRAEVNLGRASASALSATAVEAPQRYPLYKRAALSAGRELAGPAVVYDDVATTFIDAGWHAVADVAGNLVLESAG